MGNIDPSKPVMDCQRMNGYHGYGDQTDSGDRGMGNYDPPQVFVEKS
jgi:hypothetical protein